MKDRDIPREEDQFDPIDHIESVLVEVDHIVEQLISIKRHLQFKESQVDTEGVISEFIAGSHMWTVAHKHGINQQTAEAIVRTYLRKIEGIT